MFKYSIYPDVKNNNAILMMSVMIAGKRLRISTGNSIPAEFYDKKNIVRKDYHDRWQVMLNIENFKQKLIQFYNEYEVKNGYGSLTLDEFRKFVQTIKVKQKRFTGDFWAINSDWLELIRKGKLLTRKNTVYATNTYNAMFDFFNSFKQLMPVIDLNNIDENFLQIAFKKLSSRKKQLNHSTIKLFLQYLLNFLKYLKSNSMIADVKFTQPNIQVAKTDATELIALDEQELLLIEQLELDKYLSNSRDIFLIQCYTGQRYSDLEKLITNEVDYDKRIIRLTQDKKKKVAIIPISAKLEPLLRRLRAGELTIPHIPNYNTYLKQIGQIAGFDSVRDKQAMVNGKVVIEKVTRASMLSSHVARRTFISMALKRGIAPQLIMKVTGHSDVGTFTNYAKFNEQDIADVFVNR